MTPVSLICLVLAVLHPLEIRFQPADGDRGLALDVVVHNPTSRKVFLQIVTPEVFAIEASMTDPIREVRGSAARAMGSLGNPAVLSALEAVKTHEQDDWVRGRIYDAIKACQPKP